MSLFERINQDIKKAMLAKEKEKLEALRAVKNALLVKQTEKGASDTMSAEDEIKILQKLVKQRLEAAQVYKEQRREDLADPEIFQAEIISVYLPEQLSEEQIREEVQKIIAATGASGMKDMGKVMGQAAKHFAGKADNKIVSAMVKELLS